LGPDLTIIGSDVEDRVLEKNVLNELIKVIKGYYIHFCRLITHPLRKAMTVIPLSPSLLLEDYPI
jgi:hypothetical protein